MTRPDSVWAWASGSCRSHPRQTRSLSQHQIRVRSRQQIGLRYSKTSEQLLGLDAASGNVAAGQYLDFELDECAEPLDFVQVDADVIQAPQPAAFAHHDLDPQCLLEQRSDMLVGRDRHQVVTAHLARAVIRAPVENQRPVNAVFAAQFEAPVPSSEIGIYLLDAAFEDRARSADRATHRREVRASRLDLDILH